jgi:3-hydroxyacyl-CoA dehydrogenase
MWCIAAVYLQGVGTAEDIDKGMRLGTNQPMGPLRLGDFIGRCWGLGFRANLYFASLHRWRDFIVAKDLGCRAYKYRSP